MKHSKDPSETTHTKLSPKRLRIKETRVGMVANITPTRGIRIEAQRRGVRQGGYCEGSCASPRLLYTRQSHPNYRLNIPQRNRLSRSTGSRTGVKRETPLRIR